MPPMFTDLLAASDKKPAGGDPQGTPISVRIRERVQAAGRSFNANDNIADFIEPGDRARDVLAGKDVEFGASLSLPAKSATILQIE